MLSTQNSGVLNETFQAAFIYHKLKGQRIRSSSSVTGFDPPEIIKVSSPYILKAASSFFASVCESWFGMSTVRHLGLII